jgi:hypothetical protein
VAELFVKNNPLDAELVVDAFIQQTLLPEYEKTIRLKELDAMKEDHIIWRALGDTVESVRT